MLQEEKLSFTLALSLFYSAAYLLLQLSNLVVCEKIRSILGAVDFDSELFCPVTQEVAAGSYSLLSFARASPQISADMRVWALLGACATLCSTAILLLEAAWALASFPSIHMLATAMNFGVHVFAIFMLLFYRSVQSYQQSLRMHRAKMTQMYIFVLNMLLSGCTLLFSWAFVLHASPDVRMFAIVRVVVNSFGALAFWMLQPRVPHVDVAAKWTCLCVRVRKLLTREEGLCLAQEHDAQWRTHVNVCPPPLSEALAEETCSLVGDTSDVSDSSSSSRLVVHALLLSSNEFQNTEENQGKPVTRTHDALTQHHTPYFMGIGITKQLTQRKPITSAHLSQSVTSSFAVISEDEGLSPVANARPFQQALQSAFYSLRAFLAISLVLALFLALHQPLALFLVQGSTSSGAGHTSSYSIVFHFCFIATGYTARGLQGRNIMFLLFSAELVSLLAVFPALVLVGNGIRGVFLGWNWSLLLFSLVTVSSYAMLRVIIVLRYIVHHSRHFPQVGYAMV